MTKSTFTLTDGRITEARWLPSPNKNQRPAGVAISLLVIHNISLPPGRFMNGYVAAFFQNRLPVNEHAYFQSIADLQVSAHLFINRAGEVVQFVNLAERAWHAGQSCFAGRDNCNDYSIGIELEGTDQHPFTPVQYQTLAALTRTLMAAYPTLDSRRIVGHSDIAPGRKTDPGPWFDWAMYRQLLH